MKKNKKAVTFLKQKSYLLAAILMLVAVFGMTGMYLSEQQNEKKQQAKLEQEQKEQEEELAKQEQTQPETAAVDQVIRPQNDDFLDAPEVVSTKDESAVPKEQPEPETEAAEPETEKPEKKEPAKETASVSQIPELHFDAAAEMGWPLEGNVLMDFNIEQTIYFKTLDQYKYNPAIIIQGNVNDKVVSVADGIVSNIETNEVTGCVVTVDLGDGYSAVYGQLKEVPLHAGDYVEAGATIGYVSEPTKYFSLEGANLYFQMIKDNETIDPMEFLQ